jgi:hypothetical protein
VADTVHYRRFDAKLRTNDLFCSDSTNKTERTQFGDSVAVLASSVHSTVPDSGDRNLPVTGTNPAGYQTASGGSEFQWQIP